jgi:uncharacterized membrane protein YciS (DUF1049 family)
MKKEIKVKGPLLFAVGLIVGMLLVGFTKPVKKNVKKVVVYNYVKVQDWKTEKNAKKVEYFEHLYNQ